MLRVSWPLYNVSLDLDAVDCRRVLPGMLARIGMPTVSIPIQKRVKGMIEQMLPGVAGWPLHESVKMIVAWLGRAEASAARVSDAVPPGFTDSKGQHRC